MSDWVLHHSEEDLPGMPALGIFREVLYEKLSNGKLRWLDPSFAHGVVWLRY
jgi:hypothetical protein